MSFLGRVLIGARAKMFATVATAAVCMCLTAAAKAEVRFAASGGPNVLDGDSPRLLVTGLRPDETATVHAFRQATAYEPGSYAEELVTAHAQATFLADGTGSIAVDRAVPLSGSYQGADPLGLLWSGERMEVAGDSTQPVTRDLRLASKAEVLFRVEAKSAGEGWLETRIRLTDGYDNVDVRNVSVSGLNGAFARPKVSRQGTLPAIILLHGSEGGSAESARAMAVRFANLGYASLAINYFAWANARLEGVPQAFVNIPVEELAAARAWLMQQPGVNARQVSLWGVSKGAEFALVGAAHYDWVDRVVACVPSSEVWSGFGRPPASGEVYSSWSLGGKGLPYIPYDHYDDALNGKVSAAFVHQRSLNLATLEQRAAARIPIEKTKAKLLLFAATKDVVWPSAPMTLQIEAKMREAGKGDQMHDLIFPEASHFICGTGSEPRRINPVHKPEGNDPTPEADAYAAENSWKETRAFLQIR